MRVTLSPGRERPIRDGHPWVFSGAIQSRARRPAGGGRRGLRLAGGRLGSGFYSAASQIRVRMLVGDPLREPAGGASAAGEGRPASPGVGVGYFETACAPRTAGGSVCCRREPPATGCSTPRGTDCRVGPSTASARSWSARSPRPASRSCAARLTRRSGGSSPGSPILHLGDLAARREEGPAAASRRRSPASCRARPHFEESGSQFVAELAGRPEDRLLLRPARQPAAGREPRARSPRARPLLAQRRVFALCAARPRPER